MNKQIRTELTFAFSQMHKKHLKIVPKEIIDEILNGEKDKDLFESFDKDKPFTKQNISIESLEILNKIFNNIPDSEF